MEGHIRQGSVYITVVPGRCDGGFEYEFAVMFKRLNSGVLPAKYARSECQRFSYNNDQEEWWE